MITAVMALQGTSMIRVDAMMRSRRVVSTRVPMMAGTLHPAAVISGIIARPCRPKRCMMRSVRKATELRYPVSSRTAMIR